MDALTNRPDTLVTRTETSGSFAARDKASSFTMNSAKIDASAALHQSVVGARSRINGAARIENSLLLEDVHIGAGAQVRGCVLGPGVSVKAGATINDSILVDGHRAEALLPPRSEIDHA